MAAHEPLTASSHLTILPVGPADVEPLIPILLQAEPAPSALRWSLENLSDTVYRLEVDGEPVGAATLRWEDDPAEIVEIAIAPARHGQGLGKHFVLWLVEEARRRGKSALVVGTPNASLGNLAFYQKCGFRMDQVRKDYFWYYRPPKFENGIQIRDMLVFRYSLTPETPRRR